MIERIRMTSRNIAELQPRAARYVVWDVANAGFGVRVTSQGTKSFVYVYRFNGEGRMLTIGGTPPLSLEQARAAFAEAKAKVMLAKHQRRHEGKAPAAELDPASAKSRQLQVRNDSPTVEDLWKAYRRKRAPLLRKSTLREYDRMAKVSIVAELGSMKAIDVRPRDIKRVLDEIHQNRGPVIANRTHGLLTAIFNNARNDLILEASPVRQVKQPAEESPRQRALSEAEIRGLFVALAHLPARMGLVLQLVLATGVRPGEACNMRWCDIDETAHTWTVPPEFMKTKKPHLVPLSPFALQLIEACRLTRSHNVWVFPGARGKVPIRTRDVSEAIRATETAAKLKEQRVDVFTPHDLRRSCRTGLARLGIPRHVAEACIGHEHRRGIEQVYDQYDLVDERRQALERWGAHLEALRAGQNVLSMKAAA